MAAQAAIHASQRLRLRSPKDNWSTTGDRDGRVAETGVDGRLRGHDGRMIHVMLGLTPERPNLQ
jgi:hypothetical protein